MDFNSKNQSAPAITAALLLALFTALGCGTSTKTTPLADNTAAAATCLKEHSAWASQSLDGTSCLNLEKLYLANPTIQDKIEATFRQLGEWDAGSDNAKALTTVIRSKILSAAYGQTPIAHAPTDSSLIDTINALVVAFEAYSKEDASINGGEEAALQAEQTLLNNFVNKPSLVNQNSSPSDQFAWIQVVNYFGNKTKENGDNLYSLFFKPCYAPEDSDHAKCDKTTIVTALNHDIIAGDPSNTTGKGFKINACIGQAVVANTISAKMRKAIILRCTTAVSQDASPSRDLTGDAWKLEDLIAFFPRLNAADTAAIEAGCYDESTKNTSPAYGIPDVTKCHKMAYEATERPAAKKIEDPATGTVMGVSYTTYIENGYKGWVSAHL